MPSFDDIPTITLKELRQSLGDDVSQQKLADKVGIHQSNLARIEGRPGGGTLRALRMYVEQGCDGELEVYANMHGRRFKLAL